MGAERLKQIAERFREMHQFAKDDTIEYYANFTTEKEYDLGDFGYRSTEVEIEDYEVELDAEEILDKYPITTSEFDDLADELDAFELPDATLDGVLARMGTEGQGTLVQAIRTLVAEYAKTIVSVGPLPPKPLPWPGALRADVDYTAVDFPFRYQPPPGFDWYGDSYSSGLPYSQARFVNAAEVTGSSYMTLDSLGRVRYQEKDGKDTYESGIRWKVWHLDRDGIPCAAGFSMGAEERALDADGNVIPQPGKPLEVRDNWYDDNGQAVARVREIREQFLATEEVAQTAVPDVNEWGVTYDPKTATLDDLAMRTFTESLRPGDLVNSYGRVLRVERREDGQFYCTFWSAENQSVNDDTRSNFDWSGKRIVGWADQPTALSISEAKRQGAPPAEAIVEMTYDPLTVAIADDPTTVRTTELRLGDDVTGPDFGRVVGVAYDGETYTIAMNRDGVINQERVTIDEVWEVLPINGVNRAGQPTAFSLREGAPQAAPAPVQGESMSYDPLTVPLKDEELMTVTRNELRLGDDILGDSFGRLVGIEDGKLQMDRNGKRNTYDASYDGGWTICPIDVPDRGAVPPALSVAGVLVS